MKLNYIYKAFAVYYDKENQTYIVDGYEENFKSPKEANLFIKNLELISFLSDSAVGSLYRLGFYRVSFGIDSGNFVKEEKWSNEKAVLTFFYNNTDIEVEGKINSMDFQKVIQQVFKYPKSKKRDIEIVYSIAKGRLNSRQLEIQNDEIKNVEQISKAIAKDVVGHLNQVHT